MIITFLKQKNLNPSLRNFKTYLCNKSTLIEMGAEAILSFCTQTPIVNDKNLIGCQFQDLWLVILSWSKMSKKRDQEGNCLFYERAILCLKIHLSWQVLSGNSEIGIYKYIQQIIDGFWIKATCYMFVVNHENDNDKQKIFLTSVTRNSREANMSRVQRQS